MDDIVKQAMAKWPNVPDCYDWLALDARGVWRMRDERAQQLGLAGDKVVQTALLAFINRNYAVDRRGCWFFQNGPQRVFVNLAATPYIARTDPVHGLTVQTGAPLAPQQAFLSEAGALVVVAGAVVAQVDDRDVAPLLAALSLNHTPISDDALLAWLENGTGSLRLQLGESSIAVERIASADLAARFGFVRLPATAGTVLPV
ncbi:DUF2946 family protein [Massilia sp. PWRC2]|uniref:DUF2946 family protein n=1 Tax=Massilia sp. PWRC2 TaxID=2804626 RepID=UPI003CFB7589